MLLTLFVALTAIVGVGLYVSLVRRMPNGSFFPLLGPGVLLLGLAGIGILRLLPVDATESPVRVILALVMLWVGWVGLMALLAQTLSRSMPGAQPWPVLTGGAATLAPALGFIVARMVA
ncbi:MAG: hypothetical protein VXY45_12820 [Pseudomonadota bacterium]|nr:hypothetical protein [Pseudomonadota bacterium]MEC8668713.1 hypothetical protein [Pseudomonadota bacterium]